MEEAFYKDRLRNQFGLDVLVPGKNDIATVHQIIYDELCKGEIKDSSHQNCVDIINRLVIRGAEGIVLACTELPLLIQPNDVGVPLLNTTRLHAEAAVNLALAD